METHGFHGAIGELHGLLAGVGHAQLVQAILEAHDAQSDRSVPQIGIARLLDRVVVDVDDVVEHAHGRRHRLLQLHLIDHLAPVRPVRQMLDQIDRAEVAHRDLGIARVQGDLGAQVGAVHHAHMLLRRAHVAGILEGDPGMARLEQHGQHLAPQAAGGHALEELDLTTIGLGLVSGVGLFEGLTKEVVQVRTGRRREQGPVAVFRHALHEQVGDPVRRVHVMGAAAVVTGVLAKLQEFLDVQVP